MPNRNFQTGIIFLTCSLLAIQSAAFSQPKAKSYPSIGRLARLTNGDLMCYVEITANGKKYTLGANFEICEQTQLLNKRVKISYQNATVNDCQSSEPCGKTKVEKLISKLIRSR